MLKKFVSSFLALLLLVGCGSGQDAKTDPAKDAEKIVSELGLTDKMDAVQERIVKGLFFFDEGDIEQATVYIANDKTADVVGVFDTKDPKAAREKIDAYLASAKEQMQNYYPDEVFKIDNAVIQEKGSRIVVIVTDNIEAAKKAAQSILG
jgi:hypothetical protein